MVTLAPLRTGDTRFYLHLQLEVQRLLWHLSLGRLGAAFPSLHCTQNPTAPSSIAEKCHPQSAQFRRHDALDSQAHVVQKIRALTRYQSLRRIMTAPTHTTTINQRKEKVWYPLVLRTRWLSQKLAAARSMKLPFRSGDTILPNGLKSVALVTCSITAACSLASDFSNQPLTSILPLVRGKPRFRNPT